MIVEQRRYAEKNNRDKNPEKFSFLKKKFLVQSFAQFRTFAQFRIIQIEEYLILLNDSAGEFKLLSEKVHSLTDIFI